MSEGLKIWAGGGRVVRARPNLPPAPDIPGVGKLQVEIILKSNNCRTYKCPIIFFPFFKIRIAYVFETMNQEFKTKNAV